MDVHTDSHPVGALGIGGIELPAPQRRFADAAADSECIPFGPRAGPRAFAAHGTMPREFTKHRVQPSAVFAGAGLQPAHGRAPAAEENQRLGQLHDRKFHGSRQGFMDEASDQAARSGQTYDRGVTVFCHSSLLQHISASGLARHACLSGRAAAQTASSLPAVYTRASPLTWRP